MKLWYHDTDAQFHAMVVEDSKDDSNIQYDDNQRRKSGFSQENARVRYRRKDRGPLPQPPWHL